MINRVLQWDSPLERFDLDPVRGMPRPAFEAPPPMDPVVNNRDAFANVRSLIGQMGGLKPQPVGDAPTRRTLAPKPGWGDILPLLAMIGGNGQAAQSYLDARNSDVDRRQRAEDAEYETSVARWQMARQDAQAAYERQMDVLRAQMGIEQGLANRDIQSGDQAVASADRAIAAARERERSVLDDEAQHERALELAGLKTGPGGAADPRRLATQTLQQMLQPNLGGMQLGMGLAAYNALAEQANQAGGQLPVFNPDGTVRQSLPPGWSPPMAVPGQPSGRISTPADKRLQNDTLRTGAQVRESGERVLTMRQQREFNERNNPLKLAAAKVGLRLDQARIGQIEAQVRSMGIQDAQTRVETQVALAQMDDMPNEQVNRYLVRLQGELDGLTKQAQDPNMDDAARARINSRLAALNGLIKRAQVRLGRGTGLNEYGAPRPRPRPLTGRVRPKSPPKGNGRTGTTPGGNSFQVEG